MAHDCIFCKIVSGEIPATKVYEDEHVVAFRDINPVASVHIQVIPKKHVASANDLAPDDHELLGHLFAGIQQVAKLAEVAETGYRVVTNVGKDAGQVVFHLHFHVLGGQSLGPIA